MLFSEIKNELCHVYETAIPVILDQIFEKDKLTILITLYLLNSIY